MAHQDRAERIRRLSEFCRACPPDSFSPRSRLILTYALCGFANFGSLGIMIGGLGAMVPERRHEIVALGHCAPSCRDACHLHERRGGRRVAG